MAFWQYLCPWWRKRGASADVGQAEREEALKKAVRQRCAAFRQLLSANKRALEGMSEMEELLCGARLFGMEHVRAASTRVTAAVFQMVREFQALSQGSWPGLPGALERIVADMEVRLARPQDVSPGPLLLPLRELSLADVSLVGGKMASLGEVAVHAGLDVPDGFAVTVAAYERFMAYNDLRGELEHCIQAASTAGLDALFSLSTALQQRVLAAQLPPDLEEAITAAVADMQARAGEDLLLAVRSSAVGEDMPGVSFAGQFRSELNVPPEEVCRVWKEVVACKYALAAMTYRRQHGIPDHAMPMAVGVLAMVRASAGGVAYSRDPVAPGQQGERVVINAVHGLPVGVVDGAQVPHVYVCSHTNAPELLETRQAEGPLPLDEGQARRLARVAVALEEYYNAPQDVEWAIDSADGRLVILQSRPLQIASSLDLTPHMDSLNQLPVLADGGVPVSRGLVSGTAFVARREADMLAFPEGAILVVERAWPRWAPLLSRAAGLVSESGGVAGHLASVAREYALPAVFSLPGACRLLDSAGAVTLDAHNGRVLSGLPPQGASLTSSAAPPCLMAGSPVYRCLQEVAQFVTPLHLLWPDAPDFTPEHCRSLHDIIRFCHEKAAGLVFRGEGLNGRMGKQLRVGARLQYWVVDMGGGFDGVVAGPEVELRRIASRPMRAFWKGLTAVPWAGPPATDAGGFMSAVFESAMNPALESTAANDMAERNIFIIDAHYMLLQARYGYHFCTIECRAAGEIHENFVSFQFKGGAADLQRRCLRAALLAELLEEQGFRSEVRQDALFAIAEGLDEGETLQKAALLGYVLLHSRQTDMLMQDQNRVEVLRRTWRTDMAALVQDWSQSGNLKY